jgi:hypothetical protein
MMIRFLVGLPEPTLAWLREESARLEIPISELIRRILDEKREPKPR